VRIGLFDSGIGGLTVLVELIKKFPKADFVYLGDTARLPYGNKAPETLRRYTDENIQFLESQAVDLVIIACHSASTIALETTQTPSGLPLFNMIAPSANQALMCTKNKRIGVMATKATTRSQIYPKYFNTLEKGVQVISQECPLLVPLVEEELTQDELTTLILKRYLKPLLSEKADVIILGCTHYPILKTPIAAICPEGTQLIDPAEALANTIPIVESLATGSGRLEIYLTDHSPHFIEQAHHLLGDSSQATFLFPET
jgi:glutamate racemase